MSSERNERESGDVYASGGASTAGDRAKEGNFPAGLRVIVVDDDPLCLRVVERMLQRCLYRVTTFSNATEALKMLRTKKELVDIVLSDVHMPDMDGFKLLEAVGLDLNIPVIMMSSNSDTDVVLRGVKHGAVDYLLKPVAIKELRNIWQHVVRQRTTDENCAMPLGQGMSHGRETLQTDGSRKRKDGTATSTTDGDGKGGGKKQRIVWTADLHQKFVNAVNVLGIEKSVPKRILDLMDVPVLTRENVASHLQKYRLYLKKMKAADMQKPVQVTTELSDATISCAEGLRGGTKPASGVIGRGGGGGGPIENGGGDGVLLQGVTAQMPAQVAPGLTHGHQALISSAVHHGSVVLPAATCVPMNVPTPGHPSITMEMGAHGIVRGGSADLYATMPVPDGSGHIVTGLVHGMRPDYDSKQIGLKLSGFTPAVNVRSVPEWLVDNSQLRDSMARVHHQISGREPREDVGEALMQIPNHQLISVDQQQYLQQQQQQQQQQMHIQNGQAVLAEQAKAAQELTDPLQVYLND